jgi:hypothetical protein
MLERIHEALAVRSFVVKRDEARGLFLVGVARGLGERGTLLERDIALRVFAAKASVDRTRSWIRFAESRCVSRQSSSARGVVGGPALGAGPQVRFAAPSTRLGQRSDVRFRST